jgi:hypothetical protein
MESKSGSASLMNPTCSWHLEGHPPCGKPTHAVQVLIVRGPGAGRVGEVDWCDEHEKLFYAQQGDEYLN